MKFKMGYDTKALIAAVEYLQKNNPEPNVKIEDIKRDMLNVSAKNAYCIDNDTGICTDRWINNISTSGYTLTFTNGGKTKKGYPIIDVDITVSPFFGENDFIEERCEV